MKDYTKLAKEFSKKGVRLNSNLDSFLIALQNAKEPNEDPISQWDAIRILQTMVWLEWCHTFGFTIDLDVDAIIDEESFKEEMKLRGYDPTLGLSMHESIRENLNDETKEPKSSIESNLVSSDITASQGESNQGENGTDSKTLESNETKGEAQDGSSKSG
ncbi:hypothetical protein [Leptospira levettii]|uniref:hypothetical protein n=1 Tax=Leptospira levettii TaxID=2023178 RepID=UPI00223DED80|nr:hypothetical protein [Leptospira levettii]MCW7474852.1 hypothetical protein [Leptospira levettii]